MSWLKISLVSCVIVASVKTNDQLPSIQFPLRNIQNSIDLEYNTTFQSSSTYEFYKHYKGDGYVLNLPKLNLQQIPNPYPGFIDSQEVVAVNLRENGIYQIRPSSFNSVPNMQYLELSKNRIAFCDFFNYGSCLQNLVTLVIEENRLPNDSLNRDIGTPGCFPRLQQLYIRKNHIRSLNFSLRRSFPNLVSLYLSDNEIDTCTFIHDVPSTLAHLHVERNHIFSISPASLKNLKTLQADGNIIRSICYKNCADTSLKLLGTTKLEILSLTENKITRIEACAFRDSYSLVNLNLSGNIIETINPSTFTSLRSLAQLNLDNNLLTSMPNLSGNWYLKTLSLRNNKLTEIRREHFRRSTTLRTLQLGGNGIQSIQCNTFTDLTLLQQLDLSNNELRSLPSGWMRSLTNLEYLDLRGNHFFNVHQLSLGNSLSLKAIYLQNNRFAIYDARDIQLRFPNAQVYLNSCSFNCSSKY